MSIEAEFNHLLDRLYKRRTDRLRHVFIPKQGKLLALTTKKRESTIRELQELASKALAKRLAKKEFDKAATGRKTWRTKGWGMETKRKDFRRWVRRKIHKKRGKVYVFWKKKECRYVGRTGGSGMRPSRHFKRGWFRGTTRIDVYMTQQKRSIPRFECLAIHRFRPTKNAVKSAREKYTPKCPLCAVHKKIRTEVRKIYRFR